MSRYSPGGLTTEGKQDSGWLTAQASLVLGPQMAALGEESPEDDAGDRLCVCLFRLLRPQPGSLAPVRSCPILVPTWDSLAPTRVCFNLVLTAAPLRVTGVYLRVAWLLAWSGPFGFSRIAWPKPA